METKLRRSVIPIIAILVFFGISFALFSLISGRDGAGEPNERFGLVSGDAYPLRSEGEPFGEPESNGALSLGRYFVDSARYVYQYYTKDVKLWTPEDGLAEDGSDGLTLALTFSVAEGHEFFPAVFFRSVSPDPYASGEIVRLLADGGSETVCGVEYTDGTPAGFGAGEHTVHVRFPVSEPGRYRLTLRFGDYSGEECAASGTVVIPEASERDFDLVSVDLTPYSGTDAESAGHIRAAAICRSNVGSLPYQDLQNVRLERLSGETWVDASSAVKYLVDMTQSNPYVSPVAYRVTDPATWKAADDIFCGIAEFAAAPDTRYRLTLEFCENADGSGERYVLRFEIYVPGEA